MDKYVPIEKRSKKAKQALAKARRGTWGPLNPVTRMPANPKAYNRRKTRREDNSFDGGFSLFVFQHVHPIPPPVQYAHDGNRPFAFAYDEENQMVSYNKQSVSL
jgi:hypothetical protein